MDECLSWLKVLGGEGLTHYRLPSFTTVSLEKAMPSAHGHCVSAPPPPPPLHPPPPPPRPPAKYTHEPNRQQHASFDQPIAMGVAVVDSSTPWSYVSARPALYRFRRWRGKSLFAPDGFYDTAQTHLVILGATQARSAADCLAKYRIGTISADVADTTLAARWLQNRFVDALVAFDISIEPIVVILNWHRRPMQRKMNKRQLDFYKDSYWFGVLILLISEWTFGGFSIWICTY